MLWWVGRIAAMDPAFSSGGRVGGWRHALLAFFPVQAALCVLVLLLCLVAPFAGAGLDAHFYSLDMVAFIAILVAGLIVGMPIANTLAPRYFPHPALEATANDATRSGDPAAVGTEKSKEEDPIVRSAARRGKTRRARFKKH